MELIHWPGVPFLVEIKLPANMKIKMWWIKPSGESAGLLKFMLTCEDEQDEDTSPSKFADIPWKVENYNPVIKYIYIYIYYIIYIYSITMSHIASKTLIFGATYLSFVLPMPVSPIFGRQVIRGQPQHGQKSGTPGNMMKYGWQISSIASWKHMFLSF